MTYNYKKKWNFRLIFASFWEPFGCRISLLLERLTLRLAASGCYSRSFFAHFSLIFADRKKDRKKMRKRAEKGPPIP